MENRSLVTIAEHSKEKILYMLEMAKQFEMNPNRRLLQGKVVATLFFEPSTRTRLSFETAANRLGARVIGFTDPKATSSSKGETLKDTIMMVSSYADIIVMRHYLEGAARYASEVSTRTHRQCRRRREPAPVTNDARPLLHLQNSGNTGKPEHLSGGRLEIRTHRPLTTDGYASLQSYIPLHRPR